jgi:hypothetical protein
MLIHAERWRAYTCIWLYKVWQYIRDDNGNVFYVNVSVSWSDLCFLSFCSRGDLLASPRQGGFPRSRRCKLYLPRGLLFASESCNRLHTTKYYFYYYYYYYYYYYCYYIDSTATTLQPGARHTTTWQRYSSHQIEWPKVHIPKTSGESSRSANRKKSRDWLHLFLNQEKDIYTIAVYSELIAQHLPRVSLSCHHHAHHGFTLQCHRPSNIT